MKIKKDGFHFDFRGAKRVFAFDESNNAPMKKVDLIAEFEGDEEGYDVYVEIKDLTTKELPVQGTKADAKSRENYNYYLKYLKYKYRDTYLYRHAEDKVRKPIYYICLLILSPKSSLFLCNKFGQDLRTHLPVEPWCEWKWKKKIVDACHVVNEELWQRNFSKEWNWKLERLSTESLEERLSGELA